MNKNELITTIQDSPIILIPDIIYDEFQNVLTENKINTLFTKSKDHENKGFISYDKYLIIMKEVFDYPIEEEIRIKIKNNSIKIDDNTNIEECLNSLYKIYFIRFREMKCIIQNDKNVFYLTDIKPENYISTFNLIYSLTIFLKCPFYNKLKLIFKFTDIDEDGFLGEKEILNMISNINFLFCEEINTVKTNSSLVSQSLMNLKLNNVMKELLYEPGGLYNIIHKEKCVNFSIFYNCIQKINNYKFRIIPCFINLKNSLSFTKKENIININDKNKYDFIRVSSAISSPKKIKESQNLLLLKRFSSPNLNTIFKSKRLIINNLKKQNNDISNLPSIKSTLLNKTNHNINLNKSKNVSSKNLKNNSKEEKRSIYDKKKAFKDLLKETHIVNIEKEQNLKGNRYYLKDPRKIKYFFEAKFDTIRNVEVEPAIIK